MKLYASIPEVEKLARFEAQNTAQRVTQMAKSLITYKSKQRYLNLIENHPRVIHRIPQKYIASYLGLTPESLSRLRKNLATK